MNTSWYNGLLMDYDIFRKRILIVFFFFGLVTLSIVGVISIRMGQWFNLVPLAVIGFVLASGFIASLRASRKVVAIISHLLLALYPLVYLMVVLSPYTHHAYVILLLIMPPIVEVLSPRKQKQLWLIYSSAFIFIANAVALFGVTTSWTRDYTPKDIVVLHAATSIIAVLSYIRDRQSIRNLEAQALNIIRDERTGLPTMAAMGEALRTEAANIVCVVSIDNFYELSVLFGYEFCEEIVACAASRLAETVRNLGGICFKLYGRDLGVASGWSGKSEAEARKYVEGLHRVIGGPVELRGKRVEIQYSIGYTMCTDGDSTRALNEAGGALWRGSGRHVVCKHDEGAFGAAAVELSFARLATLSRCIREGGLEAQFQPVVGLTGGQTMWHEALLRVRGDSGSLEPPALYLELARSTGYWGAISDFMLGRAVDRIRSGGGSVSINIGLADLSRDDFRHAAAEGAALASERGCYLILELLETESDGFSEEQLGFVEQLRAEGCLIAIDDFGTGYSNYTRLLGFPADIVKFDISLAKKALDDGAVSALVGGLAGFCSSIGVITVVEGVETKAAAKHFKDMGFDFGQGFFWSRAIPSEEAPPAWGMPYPLCKGSAFRAELHHAGGFATKVPRP
jgi:EAL domain-containing protein (putative c-di-GMP-specific phosphodiesterase class I)/GGDEF domain-containing protein